MQDMPPDAAESAGLLADHADQDDGDDGDAEPARRRRRPAAEEDEDTTLAEDEAELARLEAEDDWSSLWRSVRQAGVWPALATALAAALAYHFLVRSNIEHHHLNTAQYEVPDRVVPSPEEQQVLKMRYLDTIATFEGLSVQLRPDTDDYGHTRLPDAWFDSVHVGVPSEDGETAGSGAYGDAAAEAALREALAGLDVPPTAVYPASFASSAGAWRARGAVARFRFADLEAAGLALPPLPEGSKPQSNRRAWQPATDAVARLCRERGQMVLFQWFPQTWGARDAADADAIGGHVSVLQEVVPVRAGYQGVRSKGVAYEVDGKPREF